MLPPIILCLIFCITVCFGDNKSKYQRILLSYISSTDISIFENSFISVPIDTIMAKDGSGLKNRNYDYAVLTGYDLFEIFKKTRSYNIGSLSDFILGLLVRELCLKVSMVEYNEIKPFLISKEDSKKYLNMDLNKLYLEYSKGNKTEGYLGDGIHPDYKKRCMIHSFFHHGYSLFKMFESRELIIYPVPPLSPK